MGRDWYALRLKEALDLPYARAKRIGQAAQAVRPEFQTELGAIVTTCELDPRSLGAVARGEQVLKPAIMGWSGRQRTDLVDALLPDEVPSSVWVRCIAEFSHELNLLGSLVEEVGATGDEGSDELLLAALKRATWLSGDHRRWLSTIRETLILRDGSWNEWWWDLDPRQDLLGTAELMRSYDRRLRPILGERLTRRVSRHV